MSVRAGRLFLAFTCVLLVASFVWLGVVGFMADPLPGAFIAPSVLGLVALVFFIIGALMLSRFVEVAVGEDDITVRYVVGPRRSVPLSKIDEVVLLQHLTLPAWVSSSTPRVLLRRGDHTLLAFTPRGRDVAEILASGDLQATVISDPLTPIQASRRYRRSVSVGELIGGPMLWAGLVVPGIVIAWAIWRLVHG